MLPKEKRSKVAPMPSLTYEFRNLSMEQWTREREGV